MTGLHLVLLVVAAVFFVLSAMNVGGTKINLVALGLLAWVLVPITQALNRL